MKITNLINSSFSKVKLFISLYSEQFFILVVFFVFSITSIAISPLSILNENQILYLFSTSAQVIAGIFGFLIAGFIFFRSCLDKEVENDNSKYEIAIQINKDNFISFFFISFFGLISILLSLLCISFENIEHVSYYNILLNITISLICVTLLYSIIFSIILVDPKK